MCVRTLTNGISCHPRHVFVFIFVWSEDFLITNQVIEFNFHENDDDDDSSDNVSRWSRWKLMFAIFVHVKCRKQHNVNNIVTECSLLQFRLWFLNLYFFRSHNHDKFNGKMNGEFCGCFLLFSIHLREGFGWMNRERKVYLINVSFYEDF